MNLCAIDHRALVTEEVNSLIFFFNNCEGIAGRVHSKSFDVERGRRDSPPLDRFSTRDRRDAEEAKAIILPTVGSDEVPACENLGGVPLREYLLG